MSDLYHVAKDFAGPVATIIAASVAAVITWKFNRAQRDIAQSQRDIAFDRLKYDLFERRYEVNDMVRRLFERLGKCTDPTNDPDMDMMRLRIRTEPRYFFPADVAEKFEEFERVVQQYFQAQLTRDQYGQLEPERREYALKMNAALMKLLELLDEIHEAMGDELAFSQLTTRRA
jgi:hypothetical protein